MSVENIRFRMEGALVVLQVLQPRKSSHYYDSPSEWRDAKTEDLLDVAEVIRRVGYVDTKQECQTQSHFNPQTFQSEFR